MTKDRTRNNGPLALAVENKPQSCLRADDVPIAGLRASNTGPTLFGQATWFYTTVDSGTNVRCEWNCGDGHIAYGHSIRHTYAQPGEYMVTVTASNAVSKASATTFAVVDTCEVWDGPINTNSPQALAMENLMRN